MLLSNVRIIAGLVEMKIEKLDHVNIRTTQLDSMCSWYENVIGLKNGFRPKSRSDGCWLYAGESPIVHLVKIDDAGAIGSESSLKLEHFSLKARGSDEFESKLKGMNEQYKRVELAEVDLVLYNVWDPDGNHIHIDFSLSE